MAIFSKKTNNHIYSTVSLTKLMTILTAQLIIIDVREFSVRIHMVIIIAGLFTSDVREFSIGIHMTIIISEFIS